MASNRLFICRHGETEWSLSGQHTSITDLPLTEHGERQAQELKRKLGDYTFSAVFVSPLLRARMTCDLTGFGDQAIVDGDLFEWRYGSYEGLTSKEIHNRFNPSWNIFNHGAPDGESVEDVMERADRMIEKVRSIDGDVAIFSSGHFSRVLAVRWLGLPVIYGRNFALYTATLSILGEEHDEPAVVLWNS